MSKEINYWIITDTHFGHQKMVDAGIRPQGFEEKIFKNVGMMVREDDILIHLGDLCIGEDATWSNDYCGIGWHKNWLIRGNHDSKSLTWYLNHGWDFVGDRIEIRHFGKRIILSHRPIEMEGDYLNIHGHHHNTLHHPEDKTDERHRLVYIEHDYRPISLRSIVERS